MSAPASTPPPSAEAAGSGETRLPAAQIDASLRWPLLLVFSSAAAWLLVGLVLSLITAIKLHAPDFVANTSWLTLGRVRPAAMNCVLYGFASQASLGLMLWLLCRLGGNRFAFQIPTIVAAKLWNLGVTIGVIAILAGASTGFEWLEMPRYANGLLFVAYLLIGLCVIATFQARRVRELYPSQWFLLVALFWFPWAFSAANHLLILFPVRGTMQAVVNGWFTGSFATLWLGAVAVAAIYYFVPRLTEQPLYSSGLAAFAFWTLLGFGGFTGLIGLIGGPVPRWMPAVSTAATVCLLFPIGCNLVNWHLTASAGCRESECKVWKNNLPLHFIMLGVLCYALNGLLNAFAAFPHVASVLNLTYFTTARHSLFLFGCVGSVLFGALYYILPRVAEANWANEKFIRLHLYCTLAGVALIVFGLALGGFLQGRKLANPSIAFLDVVKATTPMLGISTLGWTTLLLGQCLFAVNLLKLLRGVCETVCRPLCAEICGCATVAKAGGKS